MSSMTLPPGFRFHPNDDELVGYYLKRKVDGLKIELEVIPVIELYKFDPWELPDKSFLPKRDMEWFFFCPRDRKYPNGSRTNRATCSGYWKATGKDRKIVCESSVFGLRKTLVFYRGRAPGGQRTNWIMHEYRLCEDLCEASLNFVGAFALCRIAKRDDSVLKTQSQGESNAKRSFSSLMFDSNRKVYVDKELDSPDDSSSLVTSTVNRRIASTLVSSPEDGTRNNQQKIMLEPENMGFWDASKASSPDEELSVLLSGTAESCNIFSVTSCFNFPAETSLLNDFHVNQSLLSYPILDHSMGNNNLEDNLVQNLQFQGPNYFNSSYNGCETWNIPPSNSICRQASEDEALRRWLQEDNQIVLT